MPYAVIDFETTGLMPERSDRVLEVGVVLSDDRGQVEHEWTTLVNPGRDVGAAHIHGIRAADVLDAPGFADITDHLLELVAGRTVVAHNAWFDMRFLRAELLRAGHDLDHPPAVCSMRWAGRTIGAAALWQCCEALGIELVNAHTALDDARATSRLVAHLVEMVGQHPSWVADRDLSASFAWPGQRVPRPAPRTALRGAASDDPHVWLRSVLQAAWIPGSPEDEASYLLLLSQALLDRHVSVTEGRALQETAEAGGLTRETISRLHHDHLRAIAVEALADGVVTPEERVDLERVAAALGLGVPYVDEALAWAASVADTRAASTTSFTLAPGDRVVFTGEMAKPRDTWVSEIVAAGLASGGVTKSTKVLVSADPDSMSGKAAKARSYGIPVISEEAFARLFDAFRQEHAAV
ncbi:DNA polymerase III subunit epsilon [Nocardioides sp. Y6]|uniref:DNA polymerase III subunit epsilon n=1 Tax=Nocardioides malaquae TaxID=2773426 RepID=A0ABR9RTL1_9ACTN|nr:exonuclease domain-containing protein [Nocardioides malaquae]MBE7324497.1 DNA polymerase III subunit epsilon [Nocardioides malaquae]